MGLRDDHARRTRNGISDAALRLFIDNGYDATTVDEVADAAGVSRSTVFRYFPEKEELVFAREVDHLRELQRLLRSSSGRLRDRQSLHEVFVAFARHLEGDETLRERVALVVTSPRLYARSVAVRAAWEELVARELADGRRPQLSHRVLAGTVVGAVFSAVREWQESGGRLVPLVKRALGYTTTEAVV